MFTNGIHAADLKTPLSHTEENYLKAIFKLSELNSSNVSTNAIAEKLSTTAASVTDMLKKLASKKLLHYEKYYGVTLTEKGKKNAKDLIRKHRLWETFLVDKLRFSWDEVDELAEQLEHIRSEILTDRIDQFLGYPKFDPHGDPIPDKHGNIAYHEDVTLESMKKGESGIIVGVIDHSTEFLRYLDKVDLVIHTRIHISEDEEYDQSKTILVNHKHETVISQKVAANLLVRKTGN
ncbi:MAG TPA: metal-dependent transcriptional regulator [Chitinophagales bacterium]|nr:metal-dependent transcriptional regulator [Chitinophagales bacterium]